MSREAQEAGPFVHRNRPLGWLLPLASGIAALVLVTAGLVLVRWVGAATASNPRGAVARVTPIPVSALPFPSPSVTADPTEEIDLVAAYEEAMRLAYQALGEDDLGTARDLFFLATQAMPDAPEATDRLRQVEIAQTIEERRINWDEAMEELAELRAVAPFVPKVVDAHVTALVAVGREALERNNRSRAVVLCDEAVRSRPERSDARACLSAAGAIPGVPFTPVPTPRAGLERPSPTITR